MTGRATRGNDRAARRGGPRRNNGQKVKEFTDIHVYSKHKGDWWNSAGPMVSWTASDILASGEGYARMIYEIYGTTSITKSGKEMAKQVSTIK